MGLVIVNHCVCAMTMVIWCSG